MNERCKIPQASDNFLASIKLQCWQDTKFPLLVTKTLKTARLTTEPVADHLKKNLTYLPNIPCFRMPLSQPGAVTSTWKPHLLLLVSLMNFYYPETSLENSIRSKTF